MDYASRPLELFSSDGLTPESERTLARIASLAGALTLLLGVAGVCGWIFDIQFFRHIIANAPPIRPVSGLTLALLGGALWLSATRPAASGTLALVAALVASLSLLDELAGVELALRRVLVNPAIVVASVPDYALRYGAVSPLAAVGFQCLGLALLAGRTAVLVGFAQALTITVMFVALVSILGYV